MRIRPPLFEVIRRVAYWEAPYDYIIFKDGNLIKAKNGRTGVIEFSGGEIADVVSEILASTDALSLYIAPGEYHLTKSITISKDGVNLIGAGESTVLIKDDISINAIEIENCSYVRIEKLTIDGNSTGTSILDTHNGIRVNNCSYVTIANNHIKNNYSDGIRIDSTEYSTKNWNVIYGNVIEGNWNGIFAIYSADMIIMSNRCNNNANIGIVVSEPCQRSLIALNEVDYNDIGIQVNANEVSIISNTLLFNDKGIYVFTYERDTVLGNISAGNKSINIYLKDTNTIVVEGNYMADCSGEGGISLKLENVTKSQVIGNSIIRVGNFKTDYGIYVDANSSENIINDNIVWGSLIQDIYIEDISAQKSVKNNYNYATENSGIATFSGDGSTTQFTIPHGLVAEPSKVQITPMSADAAGDFYITKDATNIYVNYKTAPASGTDNIVLSWYAEV